MRKTILALGSAAALSLSGAGIVAAQPADTVPDTDAVPAVPETDTTPTDVDDEAAPTDTGSAAAMLCALIAEEVDDADDSEIGDTDEIDGIEVDTEADDTEVGETDAGDDEALDALLGDDTDAGDPAVDAGDPAVDAGDPAVDATTYQDTATDEDNLEGTETEEGADTGLAGADPVEPAGEGETVTDPSDTEALTEDETDALTEDDTDPEAEVGSLEALTGADCEVSVAALLAGFTGGELEGDDAEFPVEESTPDAGDDAEELTTADDAEELTTADEADELTTEDDAVLTY